jgi:hypothetical protein
MSRKEASPSLIATIVIFAVSILVALTDFGIFGIAQGQGNLTIGNLTLTPEQKAAICDPNNPLSNLDHVNTTESKICGIPQHNATSPEGISPSANMTTGAPPEALAPSASPSPEG